MRVKVSRTDPSGAIIDEVFIADSGDVSTLGNGLNVGDVVILYTSIYSGPIPPIAGQTIILDNDMGPYAGVRMVTNAFTDGGDKYMVIDAQDHGGFTPASPFVGSFKVWLGNYTIMVKVLIYTSPSSAPQQVVLRGQPDHEGDAYLHVDLPIRDYFSHRIESYVTPVYGTPVQSAHGISAVFYRLHIAEVYDSPEVDMSDPFDGTHDIHVDSTASASTFRVAVNAVHPYASDTLDWGDTDLSEFNLIGGTTVSKVLTLAPRSVTIGTFPPSSGPEYIAKPGDWMWATLLNTSGNGWTMPADIQLFVYHITGSTRSLLDTIPLSFTTTCAALSFGFGPANLGTLVDGISEYVVFLVDGSVIDREARITEPIHVHVDLECTEGTRRMAWLNKLGGIDAHTFTGRETYSTKVKRATVRKPYGSGTGYDWTERTYRADPERIRKVSTRPLAVEYRRWLAEDLGESPNVIVQVHGRACPAILLTDELNGGSTAPTGFKPFTVDYRLGVDNLSQQA